MFLGDFGQLLRDRRPVEVVASALALRLHHVFLALSGGSGKGAGVQAGRRGIERVDVCKGLEEALGLFRGGRHEFGQRGGHRVGVAFLRGGQDLLHFLHPRQLRENGRTANGVGPLDLVARLPCFLRRIVTGAVTGTEVDDGYFEDQGRVTGKSVEELAGGGRGEGGVGEDVGEREAEDGDFVRAG